MQEYTNQNGTEFYIETEEAAVPDDADYFAYLFKVRLNKEDSDRGLLYKAIVKKKLCETKEKADMWLHSIAFNFLKDILATYKDEKTLILIPNSDKWWII